MYFKQAVLKLQLPHAKDCVTEGSSCYKDGVGEKNQKKINWRARLSTKERWNKKINPDLRSSEDETVIAYRLLIA